MRLKSVIVLFALLLLASVARAGYVHQETIDSLAQNADIIVVAQVVKVETAGKAIEELRKIPILRQHATLKILRGIKTADAQPVGLDEVILDYPDFDTSVPFITLSGPALESYQVGQIAVFPLKRAAVSATQPSNPPANVWNLVSEDSTENTLPAIKEPLDAKPPASAKEFLYRELAGMFVHGDISAIHRAAQYLNSVSWTATPSVLPILPLMTSDISDDKRWLDIAVAAYGALWFPRPTIAQFIAGENQDNVKDHINGMLIQLAFSKAGPAKLQERMLRAFVAHQESPTVNHRNLAVSLLDNYKDDALFLELERAALAQTRPGVLQTMAGIVKDAAHPLFADTMAAARKIISVPIHKQDHDFASALNFILRLGSYQDFTFLLDQAKAAQEVKKDNPLTYQAFLTYGFQGGGEVVAADRVIQLSRLYLDDPSPLILEGPFNPPDPLAPGQAPFGDFRVCDQAGFYIQEVSGQFNVDAHLVERDPIASRDKSLASIRAWLKSNTVATQPAPR